MKTPGKLKFILWLGGAVLLLMIVMLIYQLMQSPSSGAIMTLVMLMVGLLLGGVIAFLASGKFSAQPPIIREDSHTIAESMRKVFKVVTAEGHFNEIYNYEETSRIFNFIPSKKRALVIVQAKILIGYDFEKFRWQFDAETRKLRLLEFPPPEILSTETDYKYYNIEEQFFNLFSKDDLAKIQQNGKKKVIEAAKKSHLPEVAAEQMRTLLSELLETKNITLENPSVIAESQHRVEYHPEN